MRASARELLAKRAVRTLHLGEKGRSAGTPGRIALPVPGDDPRAKEVVLRLLDELGFDGVDAGMLEDIDQRL